jgi:hypothetical protein
MGVESSKIDFFAIEPRTLRLGRLLATRCSAKQPKFALASFGRFWVIRVQKGAKIRKKIRQKYDFEFIDTEIGCKVDSDASNVWLKFGRDTSYRSGDTTIWSFWVYLNLFPNTIFRYFRKFAKNQPFEFSLPILVGIFHSSRTVEGCKCFTVESGVTPKCDTDFQNSPTVKFFVFVLGRSNSTFRRRLTRTNDWWRNDGIPRGVLMIKQFETTGSVWNRLRPSRGRLERRQRCQRSRDHMGLLRSLISSSSFIRLINHLQNGSRFAQLSRYFSAQIFEHVLAISSLLPELCCDFIVSHFICPNVRKTYLW